MRLVFLMAPVVALGACAAPAPQAAAPSSTAAPAAPFNVPMDPGLIQCAQLTNPTAMSAATDWTLGQARASALSGRTTVTTDAANVARNLASYCSANSDTNVRSAAAALNF